MEAEILLALISKMVDERVAEYVSVHTPTMGPRGFRGVPGTPGEDGKPFIWEDHESQIKALVKESALKFSDLSVEELESLRGERGRDGRDGKDFVFDEHEEKLKGFAKDSAIKFSDLSPEELESLRGRPGRDGRSGRDGIDFSFGEHQDKITEIISAEIGLIEDKLKLKFSDLTEEEIDSLRGPRGQRGKPGAPGKDFIFDEHREFFESLKLKFSDLTEEEVSALKLKFKDLSAEEIDSLKLKFSDLTDEDRILLKGPRGQRGRPGRDGIDGKDGKEGKTVIGPVGPTGLAGSRGKDGQNGQDGKDAPSITDLSILEHRDNEISLMLEMDNGTFIETNRVAIPGGKQEVHQMVSVAVVEPDPALLLELTFKSAYRSNYKELVYTLGNLSAIEIWDSAAKLVHLFTKELTMAGDDLVSVLITDNITGSTLNKVLGYTGDDLTSVTKTYTP